MTPLKYIKITSFFVCCLFILAGCTKLDQDLNSTLTTDQAADAFNASLFLQSAYNDVGGPYSDLGSLTSLQEVSADECVVPTRGPDWDDNGKWRALHQHTWTPDNVDNILNAYNNLNKLNFDATNVLTFNASPEQAGEARFLRAFALYQLLDFFGQFPLRQPGENLLNAPKVYSGDSAVNFIIDELTTILPDLSTGNPMNKANPDAAKMLLMKLYLNHGAFVNREAPTFDAGDMQKVIDLGNSIINSGKYSYSKEFFDNFNYKNSNTKEGIFACPNSSGVSTNNTGINNRWWPTLHYDQYTPLGQQGGWNGFSTVNEFYKSFGVGTATTGTPADTAVDSRIGGRFYPGCTDSSGVRPGLLIGQQYNEKGQKEVDRKGNLLIFDPNISSSLKETGSNLEVTGIRIVKYPPDYSLGTVSYSTAGNWLILYRYPDVVLMVAEAMMRLSAANNPAALTMVNNLRAQRGAKPLPSMTLVNTSDVYDPNTLLAERGRELYWEAVRRTDLIRFGVFLKPWAYKPTDDKKYLLYPIPTASLAANPNLKQNDGY